MGANETVSLLTCMSRLRGRTGAVPEPVARVDADDDGHGGECQHEEERVRVHIAAGQLFKRTRERVRDEAAGGIRELEVLDGARIPRDTSFFGSIRVVESGAAEEAGLFSVQRAEARLFPLTEGRLGEVYNVGGHNERNNLYIVKRIISEVARITWDTQITEDLIPCGQ